MTHSSTPREATQLSANAVTVLEKRYLIKDDSGKPVEQPEDLFWRVATDRCGAPIAPTERPRAPSSSSPWPSMS